MNARHPPTGIPEAKAALRSQIRSFLGQMSEAERAGASRALCERLASQEIWHKAESVLFYAPMVQEPDVWPLLVSGLIAGKTVALPRYLPEQRDYTAARIRERDCSGRTYSRSLVIPRRLARSLSWGADSSPET